MFYSTYFITLISSSHLRDLYLDTACHFTGHFRHVHRPNCPTVILNEINLLLMVCVSILRLWHVYVCLCVCMYICRYVSTYVRMHVCVCVCVCVYVRPLCIALVLMEKRFWKWDFPINVPMPNAYSTPWIYWECAELWIALRITFCWKDKMISHSCLRTTEILRAEKNSYNMNNKMCYFLLI